MGLKERCGGSNNEMTCSVSYKKSDETWRGSLDGGSGHRTIVINGTFTIESGSGTLNIRGADGGMEYPLSPEQPVVVENLTLELYERAGQGNDTLAVMETAPDGTIEGFSAEYTFVTTR